MVRGHTVDISGLLAGSRNTLQIEDEVPVETFEGIVFDRPAMVRLELRSAGGWLELRGEAAAGARAECDVCLARVEFAVAAQIDERFETHGDGGSDPFGEANVIVGTRLDVADLAQQVLLSALPMGVRCPRHSEGTMERGELKVEDSAQ